MWEDAQRWESDWWDTCQNTYGEEEKQLLYARRMGIEFFHDGRSPYNIKGMEGKRVIDIGGGPVSMLLKANNVIGTVVDPLDVPLWVKLRYKAANINFVQQPAEEKLSWFNGLFDEAWIYNCLQHTQDPKQIIRNVQEIARIIRIFEWLDTRINEGHPHSFTSDLLDEWLGGEGKVEVLNGEAHCYGKCYYGIFPTKNYENFSAN